MTGLLRRLDGWWAAREQRRAVAVLSEQLDRIEADLAAVADHLEAEHG